MLDRYSEQRLKQQEHESQASVTAKSAAPNVPAKAFAEDAA